MKRYSYAVTYEFNDKAPSTVRGEIAAGTQHTAASRALREARKAMPKTRPSSVVLVIEQQGAA